MKKLLEILVLGLILIKPAVGADYINLPKDVASGNKYFKTIDVPKIVSGETSNCLKIAKLFYKIFFKKVVPVSSTKTAEFTKLLENIYRSVNIGLVNEMKIISKME